MKYKKLLAVLLIGILAIGIIACGNKKDNTEDGAEVEIKLLPWLQLSSIEKYPELRQMLDTHFGVTGEAGNKVGDIYYNIDTEKADQNVTLYMVLKNNTVKGFFITEDSRAAIGQIAENYFVDEDINVNDDSAFYAAVNAYFDLLPDEEEGTFDGSATISRAQAMTLLMRATTQVNEDGAPETDKDFTSKVGKSQYTDFAAPMDKLAYINTKTGLNEDAFNSAMTRAEYIALVTNYLTANYEGDVTKAELTVITDGGSEITYADAIKDASTALPTDLYSTLSKAVALGLIDESALEDWDSSITKAEAIEYFVNMTINMSMSGSSETVTHPELLVDPSVEPSQELKVEATKRENMETAAYGKIVNPDVDNGTYGFNIWAQSQGADLTYGWTFIYYNGGGAGDQPSYGVYMKEGSPLYGTVYHVGDYLPNGVQFTGTSEEYNAWLADKLFKEAMEDGNAYIDEETGKGVLVIGGDN